jgi:hypothetical protein
MKTNEVYLLIAAIFWLSACVRKECDIGWSLSLVLFTIWMLTGTAIGLMDTFFK